VCVCVCVCVCAAGEGCRKAGLQSPRVRAHAHTQAHAPRHAWHRWWRQHPSPLHAPLPQPSPGSAHNPSPHAVRQRVRRGWGSWAMPVERCWVHPPPERPGGEWGRRQVTPSMLRHSPRVQAMGGWGEGRVARVLVLVLVLLPVEGATLRPLRIQAQLGLRAGRARRGEVGRHARTHARTHACTQRSQTRRRMDPRARPRHGLLMPLVAMHAAREGAWVPVCNGTHLLLLLAQGLQLALDGLDLRHPAHAHAHTLYCACP